MRTREISIDEAYDLSKREEGHFFDRKAKGLTGKKVQKIAVAFANADGGDTCIGIADDGDEPDYTKRWNGHLSIEELNPYLQALFEINPSVDFSYEFLKCTGQAGYVLRLQVEKSSQVHKTSDNTVYQRVGAQSLPIKDPQRIMELSFAKGDSSYEDVRLNGLEPDGIVYSDELRKFLSEYSPKTDPLDYVLNQNIIDSKTFEAKVCGVLLFHPVPPSVMPKKCSIKIARYTTKEDDPERDHLESVYTIEGSLYPLLHDALSKLEEILTNVKVWTPDGLKEMSYPPEAIWETLVNAVIHRDYSVSDDVHIYIYENRIEILSPGKLPGYVTVENILDARYSRNPRIVRTLNWYKDAPNKDLGEGLNTAFQKMKEWKLREPTIEEVGNYVKVTLPHMSLAVPAEAILKYLSGHFSITNKNAREITGIRSENLVKVEFYKLRDEGLIERVPNLKGPSSAWQLTETGRRYVEEEYSAKEQQTA